MATILWVRSGLAVSLLLGAVGEALAADLSESWIVDENGCKTWNPNPVPNESVRWSGYCKDGFLDGPGVLHWLVNGELVEVEESTMIRGRPSGFTKFNSLAAKESYEGEYLNGRPHGFGEFRNVVEGWRYVGEFWEGEQTGLGTIYTADGDQIQGTRKNGVWTGLITETYTNGNRSVGPRPDNRLFTGPTTAFFSSGDRVDGMMVDGQWDYSAPCRYTFANDSVMVGKWKLTKDNKSQCDKTFGSKVKGFLADMVNVGANAAVAVYAAENNIPLPAGADPFGVMSQVYELQTARIQQRQQQAQQQFAIQAAVLAARQTAAPPATSVSNSSADAQIAALQAQLRQQQAQLTALQQVPAVSPDLQGSQGQPSRQVQQPRTTQTSPQPDLPARQPPLSSNCVQNTSGYGLTDLQVNVANGCGETINVNVCVRLEDDVSVRENSRQMRAGANTQFSFFSPDKKTYKYELRYCRPGGTTATNNCPAPCP